MTNTIDTALDADQEVDVDAVYAALGDNVDARGAFWRVEQGLRGVMLANADVHAEWEKSKQEVIELRTLLRNIRHCINHFSDTREVPWNPIRAELDRIASLPDPACSTTSPSAPCSKPR